MNKQYKNMESGEVYAGKSVVVERDGRRVRVFNPQERHLLEAGYEVYEPADVVAPTAGEGAAEERRMRMVAIEAELRSLDYLTSKYVDGEDMSAYDERYGGDWRAYRKALREEYRTLESVFEINS